MCGRFALNAKVDDLIATFVAEKPSFRASVGYQRAIIPASGYYEWHTIGKIKTPHYIHSADGLLAFAALYSWWRAEPAQCASDADGGETDENNADTPWILTATMLTMNSVPALAGIHDRNPVMLPREWWDDWLSPETHGVQAFVDAAVAASVPVAEALRHHPVGPVRDDGPHLIEPVKL